MTEGNGSTGSRQSLFWLVYGQIAAMLGAFSLLVFLTHFFDVGLNGVVRDAFQVWTTSVRPVVGYPLQLAIDQLPETMRFSLSDFWKDYFAVGLVSTLSILRLAKKTEMAWFSSSGVLGFLWDVWVLILNTLAWPLMTIMVSGSVILERNRRVIGQFVTWLAPLIYLGLLFAANAWLV